MVQEMLPWEQCALFLKKMENQFNKVSNQIIQSYQWELTRKNVVPKDSESYKNAVKEKLGVDQNQLTKILITRLKNNDKIYYEK